MPAPGTFQTCIRWLGIVKTLAHRGSPYTPDPTSVGTSTGEGTSSSTGAGDDSTGGFLPDAGTVCRTPAPCSLVDQDCCPGEACKPWASDGSGVWNATRCSVVDDEPSALGEACTVEETAASGLDSCDAGLMCWHLGADALDGECVEFCSDDEAGACSQTDHTCVIANDGALPLCLASCDPLMQDCGEGFGCYPSPAWDNFVCQRLDASYVACPEGGTQVADDALPDCTPGEPCCATFCDLSAKAPCGPGTQCVALGVEAHDDVGVCVASTK